jgi:hypothetical protein
MNVREYSWTAIDRQHEEEQHAAEVFGDRVSDETRQRTAAMRNAVLAGDKPSAKKVCDDFLEFLANNDQAMETLVRTALSCSHEVTGARLVKLIGDVIQAEAEDQATKQVERMEREEKDDPDNCVPMTRAMARRLDLTTN